VWKSLDTQTQCTTTYKHKKQHARRRHPEKQDGAQNTDAIPVEKQDGAPKNNKQTNANSKQEN